MFESNNDSGKISVKLFKIEANASPSVALLSKKFANSSLNESQIEDKLRPKSQIIFQSSKLKCVEHNINQEKDKLLISSEHQSAKGKQIKFSFYI